jgi:hypothetical protein
MMQMMENAFTAIVGLPREDRERVESALRLLENNYEGVHFVSKLPDRDLWIANIGVDLRIIFKRIEGGVEVLDVFRHKK